MQNDNNTTASKATIFFSVLDGARIKFRRRITEKSIFFSAQRVHWIVVNFRKKQLISRNKKKIEKKQVYLRR